jgi:tubulin beta
MGTKFWEVVCDDYGIGGNGEYCGDSDTQLGLINVIYHEASGGKYRPRAVLFDLEPGVIGTLRASPLGKLFRSENHVNQNAGAGSNSDQFVFFCQRIQAGC